MTHFYPDDAPLPESLQTEQLLLRPLRSSDVSLDYDAVMETPALLRRWAGVSWPSDDFTLGENLSDLEIHEQEHINREAFTFTVMSPTETECLGCVYITPLADLLRAGGEEPDAIGADEAVARFWVRSSRWAEGLDEKLLEALEGWFARDWGFSRVVYRTNARDERQRNLFEARGHLLLYTLDVPARVGPYLVYS